MEQRRIKVFVIQNFKRIFMNTNIQLSNKMQPYLNRYFVSKNNANEVAKVKLQFIKFLEENKFEFTNKEKEKWNFYNKSLQNQNYIVVHIITSLNNINQPDIEVCLYNKEFETCFYSFKSTLKDIEELEYLLTEIQKDMQNK
jgi:hypothetical protein